MRHYRSAAGEPSRPAALRWRERNSTRAWRNGHIDFIHAAWGTVRSRSQETKSRWRVARLRLGRIMSRIGNKPVGIPDKVQVNIDNDGAGLVEAPKAKPSLKLPRDTSSTIYNNTDTIAR